MLWGLRCSRDAPAVAKGRCHPQRMGRQLPPAGSHSCARMFRLSMCSALLPPQVGACWSSWYATFREADECVRFLGLSPADGDRCLGVFVIGATEKLGKIRATRQPIETVVEWRLAARAGNRGYSFSSAHCSRHSHRRQNSEESGHANRTGYSTLTGQYTWAAGGIALGTNHYRVRGVLRFILHPGGSPGGRVSQLSSLVIRESCTVRVSGSRTEA